MSVPASAQDWAGKMFQTSSHDFGVVARGEKAEFAFVLENLYVEGMHIAGVRASCHCTSPEIETETLKTHQKGAIIARFNTAAFLGSRGATLTVTFDRPYFAEVQLNVRGLIRSDLALQPGSVDFGTVDQGSAEERTVTVSHTGGPDWRITGVRSVDTQLSATATELNRSAAVVTYQIVVHVDQRASAGYLAGNLTLVTNDLQSPEIQVPVSGIIRERISASPAPLFLGVVEPGQKTVKQIVVWGKEPFRVTETSCKSAGFKIAVPDGSQRRLCTSFP